MTTLILSYEALFDQNSWPIEIMCTGINELQNIGANTSESETAFSAKESMGYSKYRLEICQKNYTTGFLGQKFYTLKLKSA